MNLVSCLEWSFNSRGRFTYGRKLIEQGVKHVIVSMAGEGALLFTAEGIYEATVPKVL